VASGAIAAAALVRRARVLLFSYFILFYPFVCNASSQALAASPVNTRPCTCNAYMRKCDSVAVATKASGRASRRERRARAREGPWEGQIGREVAAGM
jgi:hypothetical protein